ncbi:putative ribonuclease H-like domain-containing protein, partial [Tanacetum coccineum]
YSGLDEFKEPEFKSYSFKNSKQESNIVCNQKSDDSKENLDDSLVKEQVSKDTSSFIESSLNIDKETFFPVDKKAEFGKPKNHEKPVKKSVGLIANTIKGKGWLKAVKTGRPNSAVVNVVRVNQANAGKLTTGMTQNLLTVYAQAHSWELAISSDFKEIDEFKLSDESQILLKIHRKDNTEKGIKREYSVARTPQQNGVAERRNRTLIEAARTMLDDSKLPTTFWAKQFKASLCKSDEGFLLEYSLCNKAFRVYNTRTRRVEKNLHIGFLENKPMIEGNGPKWLFDIDSLTQSMNYVPIAVGTITNESGSDEDEPEVIVWILVDLPIGKRAIGTKWVFRNKKDERGIVIRNKARLVAQVIEQERRFSVNQKMIANVKSTSTLVDLKKPLVKDVDADDVDVHLYRSMIGSLMYLTASRPDIIYLKGKPTLGLWYSRDSPFELVAYTDSDYAKATQDRKSTTKDLLTKSLVKRPVHKDFGDRMGKLPLLALGLESKARILETTIRPNPWQHLM